MTLKKKIKILKKFLKWFGSDGDRYKKWILQKPYGWSDKNTVKEYFKSIVK